MKNYSSDDLRQIFVTPMISLVSAINQDISALEAMIKDGSAPREYVPLNDATARKGLGMVEKLQRELNGKIAGIKNGTFLYRETQLKRQKEKYQEKKKTHKNNYALTSAHICL